MTLSVIVCAYNEERSLAGCLHSVLAQTRLPDEIIVVNNASTDRTKAVAASVSSVVVVDEPRKGLVIARETGRRHASGDVLVYLDADCRAPLRWLERIEAVLGASREVTSLKHFPYVASSDFHKPKHLYSWKTLLRCEKSWPAVRKTLVANVDVALTLFRAEPWAGTVSVRPAVARSPAPAGAGAMRAAATR